MLNFIIRSTGAYLPHNILKNTDLPAHLDTSDEWIQSRTGIRQRHIAAEGELTSDLAAKALDKALTKAGLTADDLDCIIVATTTPDSHFPATAVHVQHKVGMKKGFAFDLQAVCSGFIYALHVAASLINSGGVKRVALIGAETMSRIVDWNDRRSCILFGDGAAAVILEYSRDNIGVVKSSLGSNGALAPILNTPGGISMGNIQAKLHMQGPEVFKAAVEVMTSSLLDVIEQGEEVDYLVPHQANTRIIEMVRQKLDFPKEKVVITADIHANTSAASIPLALDHLFEQIDFRGKTLALTAAGAGFTWGSILLRT